MEEKETSVGLDKTTDLIKVRLPYLEQELTNKGRHSKNSPLKRSNSTTARLTYHSPRALHLENVSDENSSNDNQSNKRTAKFLVGNGNVKVIEQQMNDELLETCSSHSSKSNSFPSLKREKSRSVSGLHRSMTMGRYSQRSLSLYGQKYGKQNNDSFNASRHMKNKNTHQLPRTPANAEINHVAMPEFSQLQRSKTELEIIEQAKEMLKDSGDVQGSMIKHGVEKMGKGLSKMYLSDFGANQERVRENIGMSQQKYVTSSEEINKDMRYTAQKHIYMCQIPSLLHRGSKAKRSINGLITTISPYPSEYSQSIESLKHNYADFESLPPSRGSGQKRPLLVLADNSIQPLKDYYLGNRSYYRSMDSINLTMKEGIPSINIEGEPMSVHFTSKRIM